MKTINNKPFWYNPKTCESRHLKPNESAKDFEYWDSALEFKVYETLLNKIPASNIQRQHEVVFFEKSAIFPKWTWVIDFKVYGITKQPILIEAKGKWLQNHSDSKSFWKTLKMLQVFKPEAFSKLLIVGDGETWMIPRTRILVYPYKSIFSLIEAID